MFGPGDSARWFAGWKAIGTLSLGHLSAEGKGEVGEGGSPVAMFAGGFCSDGLGMVAQALSIADADRESRGLQVQARPDLHCFALAQLARPLRFKARCHGQGCVMSIGEGGGRCRSR